MSQSARKGARRRSLGVALICAALLGAVMSLAAPASAADGDLTAFLLKDVNPGTASSTPTSFVQVGSKVLFIANQAATGQEWRVTDGTPAGTTLLKDINPGAAGCSCFVGAQQPLGGSAATGQVFNGHLYFAANDGSGDGVELWRTDGTPEGTVLFKSINPTGDSMATFSSPAAAAVQFKIVGNTLFFIANDGVAGTELWKTDGTAAGTVMVEDINPGVAIAFPSSSEPAFVAVGNTVFMQADDGTNGQELWKSDGTAAGTTLVKDIRPGSAGAQMEGTLRSVGERVMFHANDGIAGRELWTSDGTEAGTVMVMDIWPGTGESLPGNFGVLGNIVYFSATDGDLEPAHGTELWKSDGTEAGTVQVKDIGTSSGNPQNFGVLGSTAYFSATAGPFSPSAGVELWKTDGTEAGTMLVRDIRPGTTASSPSRLTPALGTLFFSATNGTTGTSTGTEPYYLRSNFAPVATGDAYSTNEDTPLTVAAPGMLANDTDADGDAITATLARTAPQSVLTAGSTTLTSPTAAFTSADVGALITGGGIPASTKIVSVTNATTAEMSNPAPFTNTAVVLTITYQPLHGSLAFNANGSFTYTPAANYNGPDSFAYNATDGAAVSTVPGIVNLTVAAVSDNPVAADDTYSTNQNSSLTIAAPGVLGNDSDGDNDTLTAGSASVPANGAVALNPNGGFTYTPNGGYTGPDSFTYVVSDGQGGTDTGTVNITVTVPTLSASPASVSAGTAVTATWSNVGNPSATDWVGLYDSSSAPDPALLAWSFTDGNAAGNLNLTVPAGATPGTTYELRLYANNTYARIATSAPFEVTPAAVSTTTISASPSSVPAGGTVTATWADIASPNATDWVGLYDSSSAPDPALLAWAYTSGTAGGSLPLTVPAGATAGSAYELRLFSSNTYTRLATSAPFSVTASATTLSASPAMVNAGAPVTATWAGITSPSSQDWVGLYDSASAADPALLAWSYTDGNASGGLNLTVPVGATSGTTYELRLFSNNTYTRLATSSSFEVVASSATVSASPSSVAAGTPVTATWSGIGSPSATDWIGLYASSTDPDTAIVGEPTVDGVVNAWAYTGGAASGSLNLTVPASAPPGTTYELRLYSNNTYTRLATSAPFSVTGP